MSAPRPTRRTVANVLRPRKVVAFSLNGVAAFWIAYVLTRPIGASFSDWIGKSHSVGGLGVGDGTVSLIFFAAIVVLVAYLSRAKIDVQSTPVVDES